MILEALSNIIGEIPDTPQGFIMYLISLFVLIHILDIFVFNIIGSFAHSGKR